MQSCFIFVFSKCFFLFHLYPNVTTLRSGLCCRNSVTVCHQSSVTLVHPTLGVEPFGKLSSPLYTFAILWPPCKILRWWPWMTFKVIHRLYAFSNAIRRTFFLMQHFTRIHLTLCSRSIYVSWTSSINRETADKRIVYSTMCLKKTPPTFLAVT